MLLLFVDSFFFIQPQPAVVKKFQCNLCLQQFTRITNLNKHKEAVHGEGGNIMPVGLNVQNVILDIGRWQNWYLTVMKTTMT